MRLKVLIILLCATGLVFAKGRQPGDGQFEVPDKLQGSAANRNSAYQPPAWDYQPPQRSANDDSKRRDKDVKKTDGTKPVVESPAPNADAFPDYSTPQPTQTAPPLSKDSLEPPLPDEPGGDPDARPSSKTKN
jgi:hypothetical protein